MRGNAEDTQPSEREQEQARYAQSKAFQGMVKNHTMARMVREGEARSLFPDSREELIFHVTVCILPPKTMLTMLYMDMKPYSLVKLKCTCTCEYDTETWTHTH